VRQDIRAGDGVNKAGNELRKSRALFFKYLYILIFIQEESFYPHCLGGNLMQKRGKAILDYSQNAEFICSWY